MPQEQDYALVGDIVTGTMSLHQARCPTARKAAADGYPVMTMLGCASAPPGNYDCPQQCLGKEP
jgi:hypothetical protein